MTTLMLLILLVLAIAAGVGYGFYALIQRNEMQTQAIKKAEQELAKKEQKIQGYTKRERVNRRLTQRLEDAYEALKDVKSLVEEIELAGKEEREVREQMQRVAEFGSSVLSFTDNHISKLVGSPVSSPEKSKLAKKDNSEGNGSGQKTNAAVIVTANSDADESNYRERMKELADDLGVSIDRVYTAVQKAGEFRKLKQFFEVPPSEAAQILVKAKSELQSKARQTSD